MPSYKADQPPTIKVEIDFFKNGSFVDVTSDVLSFDTVQGFNKEYQQVATPGSCDLILDNTGFKYSALDPNSTYYGVLRPNTPIKISATHPSGTYTPSSDNHIYGTFDSLTTRVIFAGEVINFAETSYQNNTTVLKCTIQDYVGRLSDSGIKFPPLYRIPPHTPIDVILDTEYGGVISHGFWYFVNNPTTSDHLSLIYGSADPIVYSFVTSLSGSANEILIGATIVDSINNAYQAINGGVGAGTLYATNIQKPAFCTVQKYSGSDTAPSYLIDNMKAFVLDVVPNYVGTQGNTIIIGTASSENIWISNSEHGDGLLDAKTYLPMYETSGTTAYEYGYNNGGSLSNGTYSVAATSNTGKILRSQYFSLANHQALPINEFVITPDQFQFALWLKPPAYASAFNAVIWEYTIVDNGTTRRFVLEYNPGATSTKANFTLTNWTSFYFGSDFNFNWNDWNHIALTYDSGVCKIYVNGALVYTITESPSFGSLTYYTTFIGSDKFGARQGDFYISNYKFIAKLVTPITIWDAAKISKYYNRGAANNNSGALEGGTAGTTNGIVPYVSVNSETYFGYIGDDWVEKETTKLDAIQHIASSEFGRFFQSRNGQLVYWSNKDWLKRVNGYNVDGASVPVFIVSNRPFFETSMSKSRLYNSVNVTFSPRIVSSSLVQIAKNGIIQVPGQSGTERWNGTVVIPGGGAATIKMDFLNPETNNKCGAYYVQSPLIGGTHWNANEERDLSGVDYTYYTPTPLTFSLVHNLSGAEITIKNTALGYLWVYNITLYGKIITKESSITYTVEDQASITQERSKKVLNFEMPLDVNPQFAKEVANWLLNKFKNPIFTVPGDVDFKNMYLLQSPSSSNAKHILEAEIMDEIVLKDPTADVAHGASESTQFYSLGRAVITQIAYSYQNRNLKTKFRVEGIEDSGYFMLDNSTFGVLDFSRLGI